MGGEISRDNITYLLTDMRWWWGVHRWQPCELLHDGAQLRYWVDREWWVDKAELQHKTLKIFFFHYPPSGFGICSKHIPKDLSELSQEILLILCQISLSSQGADNPGISLQLWETQIQSSHQLRIWNTWKTSAFIFKTTFWESKSFLPSLRRILLHSSLPRSRMVGHTTGMVPASTGFSSWIMGWVQRWQIIKHLCTHFP